MNCLEIIFTDGASQIFSILELWTQLFYILTLTINEIALTFRQYLSGDQWCLGGGICF